MASASAVLVLPLVVKHLGSMHVDIPLAAFFFATLYHSLSAARARSLPYAFLALATAGMMLNIKVSGVGYAALIAAGAAVFYLLNRAFSRGAGGL